MDVSVERFEMLVGEALDGIPRAIGQYIDNVAVFVEDLGVSCAKVWKATSC